MNRNVIMEIIKSVAILARENAKQGVTGIPDDIKGDPHLEELYTLEYQDALRV